MSVTTTSLGGFGWHHCGPASRFLLHVTLFLRKNFANSVPWEIVPNPSAKLKSSTSALFLLVTNFGNLITETALLVGAFLLWLGKLVLRDVLPPLLPNRLFLLHVLFLSLENTALTGAAVGKLPRILYRAG